MGDPSEASGRCRDDLWITFGASLEAFALPERSFGLGFHVFVMPSKDHGDLQNSMVFIRREAIEGIPSEVPFSTKCLWKDLRDLVEVLDVFGCPLEVSGRSRHVLWMCLGWLGMSFGGLWEVHYGPWRV